MRTDEKRLDPSSNTMRSGQAAQAKELYTGIAERLKGLECENRLLKGEIEELKSVDRNSKEDGTLRPVDETVETILQRHYAILSSTYSAILLVTDDGYIEFANQAFCNVFHLNESPDELKGLTSEEMIQRIRGAYAYPHEAIARIVQIVAEGRRVKGEEVAMADGRLCLRDYVPIRLADKSYGRAWYHQDITERKQAEDALHQSEERYRNLHETLRDAFVQVDMDGRIIDFNDAYTQMLGYSPEEIRALTYQELTPEKWHAAEEIIVREQIIARGYSNVYQKEYRRKDGTIVPIELRTILVRDADGQPASMWGIVRDITDRKKAEEDLRELNTTLENRVAERTAEALRALETARKERQRLYDVLETLPVYVILLTADYRVPFANHFFRSRFGESEGRRCYEYLFNRIEPCEICETYTVLKTNAPHHWYWTGPDKRDYDIYDYPFVDADGSAMILEMGIDITEQKQTRRRIEDMHRSVNIERQRLYDVLDALPVRVCLLAPDYHVPFANRAFRQRFGEAKGRPCYEYCFGMTEPCSFCESFQPLETGQAHHWERTSPDGKTVNDVYDIPFTDVDGSRLILEMSIDITEQRRLEEQLRQAHKMEAIGTLAGGIAHDFNNMLAVMLGNAELLLDEIDESNGDMESSRHNADQIIKAAKRSRDLVKQILTFSRKSGSPKQHTLTLAPLVKESIKMLRGVMPSSVTINLDIGTDADTINGDPSQIQQILMNLASNAMHAMREEGGTLSINLSKVKFGQGVITPGNLQPGYYLKLTVSDTGPGIPSRIRDRIFEPFFTTKEAGEGTGMGLAVVWGIVTNHGGAITVDSAPGKGTAFNVFFPAKKKKPEAMERVDLQKGNESILLVDDEPSVLEIAAKTLKSLGYHVTTASSGREALRIFEQDHFKFGDYRPRDAGDDRDTARRTDAAKKTRYPNSSFYRLQRSGFSQNHEAGRYQRVCDEAGRKKRAGRGCAKGS